MSRSFDVAVVGLGAMGSAAVCHLAERGCSVLGLDRFGPVHSFGSSHGRTRIIREAYFEDPLYVPLVQRSYAMWTALERRAGQTLLQITGAMMIGPADGSVVRGARASAEQHGLAHEILSSSEMARRFPALQPEPEMVGVWEPRAGVLFAEACTDAHRAMARSAGAMLHHDERVVRWQPEGTGVRIVTERDTYRAGQLVLAAGPWITELVPELALPLVVERQVVYWLAPSNYTVALGPAQFPVHLWEVGPSQFFYGLPDFGDGIKVAMHHDGESSVDPDRVRREVSEAEVAQIRSLVQRFVPSANGALRASTVCLYTNTPDGHFLIDRHPHHPQVLIVSPCSGHGFKFAPVIGEAVAEWIVDGRPKADFGRFAWR